MFVRVAFTFLLALVMMFTGYSTSLAQQDEYRLNVNRTFGYGNGSDIRGTFTLSVTGPGDISSVKYLIDDQVIAEKTGDAVSFTFQTAQHPDGWHDLSAIIEKTDGTIITTPARRFNFVTAEQESSGMAGILIPLLGGIALVMAGVVIFQAILFRKKPLSTLPLGAPRQYGFRGGTICPRCQRPYPIHWWAINIGFRNRVDRCEFCGKWAVVRPQGHEKLAAAESAELEQAQAGAQSSPKTEQDRLKEMIDNSRFTDQ